MSAGEEVYRLWMESRCFLGLGACGLESVSVPVMEDGGKLVPIEVCIGVNEGPAIVFVVEVFLERGRGGVGGGRCDI